MRLSLCFTAAAMCFILVPAAFADIPDDLALCRKSWWGAAQAAACGRVISAPGADDLAKAEALVERARGRLHLQDAKSTFGDLAESIRLAPWNPETFRLRALLHERTGDAEQALADHSAAIAIAPTSDIFAARARLHSKRGDGAKAIADLTEAMALDRAGVDLLYERALIYLSQGKTVAAIKDFDAFLQDAESAAYAKQNALAGRARAFLAQGDTARAISDATAALALNPKLGAASLTRAQAYLKAGDNIPAVANATEAIAAKVRGEQAHLVRAEARLMTGDVAGARNDIALAELLAPDNPEVARLAKTIADQAMTLGLGPAFGSAQEAYDTCLNSRDNDETIASCAQVIAERGRATASTVYPHNILGHFHYERRQYDLAVEDFEAAIATGQSSTSNYSMLGLTNAVRKNYSQSIAAYEMGLKRFPADPSLILGLARVQEEMGECDAALANFAEAHRLKPDHYDYPAAARCHVRQGNYALAAATHSEELKIIEKPNGKRYVLERRAEAYVADGKIDLALQDVWSALALEPERVDSHTAVAEVLLMAGKTKDAIAVLTKAIPLDTRAISLLVLRAKAHLQAGDLEAALEDANAAIKVRARLLVRAEVRLAMKDFAGARADADEALAQNPYSFEARALKAAIAGAEAAN